MGITYLCIRFDRRRSSLALLLCVRDALVQRGEAGEQGVALVLLGLTELAVCAVEPVQDAENAKTLIEPEVVEVMELRRRQERKVVSAVGDGGADQSYAVPQGGGGQVGAQKHRPAYHRQ